MKKLISLILIFCVIWSVASVSANVSDNTVIEDENFLEAVGILTSAEVDRLNTDVNVSRGEFLNYAMRLFNTDFPDEYEQVFWDVDKNNEYYLPINTAGKMGIVSGYNDGGFHANEYISSDEAMAIIVNILGYKEYAGFKGGYPVGYLATARYLEIDDKFSFGKTITGRDIINIFSAAVNATVLETYSVGNKLKLDDTHQTSLLNAYWNIWCEEGIVNSDGIGGLYLSDEYVAGSFKVGDLTLFGETDASGRYVGYNVECYYKKGNKKNEIVYLKRTENDVLTISIENFSKTNGNEFYYFDENDKEKKVNFDYETAFLYNGRPIDYSKDYGDKLFSGETGEIVLIENSGDRFYDTVYINSYQNLSVNAVDVDNEMVFGMDKNVLGFENENSDGIFVVYDVEKNPVRIADLAKWDILTYTVSKDGEYIYAIANYGKKSGLISNWMTFSDGTEKILMNEEEYEVAKDCYRDEAGMSYFGKNATIRFNCYGEVAAIETGTGNAKDYFALCIGAKTNDGLDTDGGVIRLLDSPQEDAFDIELDKKINIDGVSNRSSKDLVRVLENIAYSGEVNGTFIRYRLNDEGKVNFVDTYLRGEKEEDNSLVRRWTRDDAKQAYKSAGYIGLRYFKNADTRFFGLPTLQDISNGDTSCDCYADLKNDGLYSIDIYSLGNDTIYMQGAVIIKDASLYTSTVDDTRGLCVVKSIRNAVDEDGEPYTKLIVVNATGEHNLKINDEYIGLLEGLEHGDVIRYEPDMANGAQAIHFVWDYSENAPVNGANHKYSSDNRTVCGTILDTYENYAKVALVSREDVINLNGEINEIDQYVFPVRGYEVEVTKNDVIYSKATPEILRTWENSTNDAQYYIYILCNTDNTLILLY